MKKTDDNDNCNSINEYKTHNKSLSSPALPSTPQFTNLNQPKDTILPKRDKVRTYQKTPYPPNDNHTAYRIQPSTKAVLLKVGHPSHLSNQPTALHNSVKQRTNNGIHFQQCHHVHHSSQLSPVFSVVCCVVRQFLAYLLTAHRIWTDDNMNEGTTRRFLFSAEMMPRCLRACMHSERIRTERRRRERC
jgi:hypothetical protein